eukprot:1367922-Amorphochlora_amoeboformis.AAC.1
MSGAVKVATPSTKTPTSQTPTADSKAGGSASGSGSGSESGSGSKSGLSTLGVGSSFKWVPLDSASDVAHGNTGQVRQTKLIRERGLGVGG